MWEQLLKHLGIILFKIENTNSLQTQIEEEKRRKHPLTDTVNGNCVT